METVWYGLKVCDDGSISDLRGRPKTAGRNGLISVTLSGGSYAQFKRERIIYMAFSDEKLDGNSIIEFINGDTGDFSFSNLRRISLAEYRRKTDFKSMSRLFTADDVLRILDGLRDKPAGMSQKDFAEKSGISLTTLKKMIKGEYRCRPEN